MSSIRFIYPLDSRQLQAFRSHYHRLYNDPLFYVSDSFIQQTFLEFQDTGDLGEDDQFLQSMIFDTVSMAENCHVALRSRDNLTQDPTRPCKRCAGFGVNPKTAAICPRCQGIGRLTKQTRHA